MSVDYQAEYQRFLNNEPVSYPVLQELLGAVALLLNAKEELELVEYAAHGYNGLKKYMKTGSLDNVTPTSLDILWLCSYITKDISYAVMVKTIGQQTKNPLISSSAQWSYNSHYKQPEEYGIGTLPAW